MITIENLSAYYGEHKVVDSVNLNIQEGKITGIIGPNGAGKSTLIRTLIGLHGEYSGAVHFRDHSLAEKRDWVKQHSGYAPEDAEVLPYLTGREQLELLGILYKIKPLNERVSELLELSGLVENQSELVLSYSHGMKQKLSLASALIGDPEYIILDESLNGLDPVALYRFKKYLNDKKTENKAIILTSHIIPLILEWCEPVIIMHGGKILGEYTKEEIKELEKKENTTFEEYFVRKVTG